MICGSWPNTFGALCFVRVCPSWGNTARTWAKRQWKFAYEPKARSFRNGEHSSMFVPRGDEKLTRKAYKARWTNNQIGLYQAFTTFSLYNTIQFSFKITNIQHNKSKSIDDINQGRLTLSINYRIFPRVQTNFHIDSVDDPWSRTSIYAFTTIFVCGVHRAEATCRVRSPTAIIPRLSYCERSVVNVCHSRSLFVVL